MVCKKAERCYDQKEFEYPVLAGLYRFTLGSGSQSRIDRDGLIAWAKSRFDVDLDRDDLRNKQRDEIRALLLQHSEANQGKANLVLQDARQRVEKIFGETSNGQLASAAGSNGQLMSLSQWLHETLDFELSVDEIGRFTRGNG